MHGEKSLLFRSSKQQSLLQTHPYFKTNNQMDVLQMFIGEYEQMHKIVGLGLIESRHQHIAKLLCEINIFLFGNASM